MLRKWHALALVVALAPTSAFASFELGIKGKTLPPVPGPAVVQVVSVDPTGPAAAVGMATGALIFNIDPETGVGFQRVTSVTQLNAFMQQSQGAVRLFWVDSVGSHDQEVHLRVVDPGVTNLRRQK